MRAGLVVRNCLPGFALLLLGCGVDAPQLPDAVTRITVGGARITILVPENRPLRLSASAISAWVQRSAGAVSAYYGRFPVPELAIDLVAEDSAVVGNAVTRSTPEGARITLGLGVRAGVRELSRDWVLVHEMVHTALPSLPPAQRWLEEGLATYVEGVARCRAGLLDTSEFWANFVAMAPEGQAKPGGAGLDGTEDWGRTYWGGATFCLLLDLAIRERTGGQSQLSDALRGVLSGVGDLRTESTLAAVLSAMDAATGSDAASEAHAAHGPRALAIDLAALWRALGVIADGSRVRFDDTATRARDRIAITTRAAT